MFILRYCREHTTEVIKNQGMKDGLTSFVCRLYDVAKRIKRVGIKKELVAKLLFYSSTDISYPVALFPEIIEV